MSLIYNGTEIPSNGDIIYNGTHLEKVICDGVEVWKKDTDIVVCENGILRPGYDLSVQIIKIDPSDTSTQIGTTSRTTYDGCPGYRFKNFKCDTGSIYYYATYARVLLPVIWLHGKEHIYAEGLGVWYYLLGQDPNATDPCGGVHMTRMLLMKDGSTTPAEVTEPDDGLNWRSFNVKGCTTAQIIFEFIFGDTCSGTDHGIFVKNYGAV